jgi:hypothetical protein
MTASLKQGLIWCAFALLLVLATAPAWRVLAFDISPSVDRAILFICSGGRET